VDLLVDRRDKLEVLSEEADLGRFWDIASDFACVVLAELADAARILPKFMPKPKPFRADSLLSRLELLVEADIFAMSDVPDDDAEVAEEEVDVARLFSSIDQGAGDT